MKTLTKVVVVFAIVYNGMLGYFVTLTTQPYVVLAFLSLDFFLIFYYMWLLIRQNLGVMKFEMEHKELLQKARQEVGSVK